MFREEETYVISQLTLNPYQQKDQLIWLCTSKTKKKRQLKGKNGEGLRISYQRGI